MHVGGGDAALITRCSCVGVVVCASLLEGAGEQCFVRGGYAA
jgi:hypothetical protein